MLRLIIIWVSPLRVKCNLNDAISSYKRAIHINPNYAWAYNNMGNALNESGDPLLALNSLEKALRLKDNYPDAYNNLGIALADVMFSKPNDSYTALIISLINKKIHVRPKDIERSAVSLLKCDPVIIEVLEKYWEGTIEASIDDVISKVSRVELLLALMKVCPLTDLGLEGFLTKIRSCILFSTSKIEISPELFRFQAALALQCFTNEYIYEVTKEEQRQVESLELSIGESFSLGHRPKPTMIMCLASYKSLFHCKWYKSVSSIDCEEEVYTRQVCDPKYENYLRSNIKKFQPVTDSVSLKVKGQYEENPYPRWVI